MLMPSANMSRMREFLMVIRSVLAPQYKHTMCSTHTSSITMSETPAKSNTLPGPSIREV